MNHIPNDIYGYGHLLHMSFCLIILLALTLIIVWAIRFAKKDELKKLTIILLIVGVLGWLLTTSLSGFSQWGYTDHHGEMEKYMEQMMGIE